MLRTITLTTIIVQSIFNNAQYVRMEESMFLTEFFLFEDVGQKSENDLVNHHYACDRNYEFASVDNGEKEEIETVSENRLEDKQIQLLKNILETNPNL